MLNGIHNCAFLHFKLLNIQILLLATVERFIFGVFYVCYIYWYFSIAYSFLHFRVRIIFAIMLILTYSTVQCLNFEFVIAY